ncbi:MAG: acyl-CoA carboxylase subunit epsilon [Jatrophihabitans sp.]
MVDAPEQDATPARPHLRIVKGDPSPEELAVLTALVQASSAENSAPATRVRRGGWNDPSALHRRPLVPGPNAWRTAFPR